MKSSRAYSCQSIPVDIFAECFIKVQWDPILQKKATFFMGKKYVSVKSVYGRFILSFKQKKI